MNAPVTLLLGVHAHQPVGNFVYVVDDAAQRCYLPFLETMARHPGVKFALHISGWLIERLAERHPRLIELVREMSARGQVEIVGGGDMEPILAAIPEADRRAQLAALADRIEHRFGVRPRGAWLAERVWESGVVPALARHARYTLVDDYHFRLTGMNDDQLYGYYTTEEGGKRIDVFPISQPMRYQVPFAPADHVLDYLGSLKPGSAVTYFDDIEKFGVWPETHAWVYAGGWLERFAGALENSASVTTETFSAYRARAASNGVVYLPSTSYAEMKDWAPGGVWKGFLAKYPEANWMHKRMLAVSKAFHRQPAIRRTPRVRALLHESQSNDAYWHGLFGGLYLPHLRRAVWRALLGVESHLPAVGPRVADVDLDGRRELTLRDRRLRAVVRIDADAALVELSSYPLRQNFCDTLRRRWEPYYERVGQASTGAAEHGGIASAHERIAYRSVVTRADLEPDARSRASFLDSWQHQPLAYRGAARETFAADIAGATVAKSYALSSGALTCSYRVTPDEAGTFAVQLNIAMPSCDGPGGRVIHGGRRSECFAHDHEIVDAKRFCLEDDELGGSLAIECTPAASVSVRPTYTVSQSEAGFEKVMQSVEVTCAWQVHAEQRLAITLQPQQ